MRRSAEHCSEPAYGQCRDRRRSLQRSNSVLGFLLKHCVPETSSIEEEAAQHDRRLVTHGFVQKKPLRSCKDAPMATNCLIWTARTYPVRSYVRRASKRRCRC